MGKRREIGGRIKKPDESHAHARLPAMLSVLRFGERPDPIGSIMDGSIDGSPIKGLTVAQIMGRRAGNHTKIHD